MVHPVLMGTAEFYSPNSLRFENRDVVAHATVDVIYPEGHEREALAALRRTMQVIEERMGPEWDAPESVGAEWPPAVARARGDRRCG